MADDALSKLLEASEYWMAEGRLNDTEAIAGVQHWMLEVVDEQDIKSPQPRERDLLNAITARLLLHVRAIAMKAGWENVEAVLSTEESQVGLAMLTLTAYCSGKAMAQRQAQEAGANE